MQFPINRIYKSMSIVIRKLIENPEVLRHHQIGDIFMLLSWNDNIVTLHIAYMRQCNLQFNLILLLAGNSFLVIALTVAV